VSARIWTVLEALRWTTAAFTQRGVQSPRLDAELLLSRATGLSRVALYTAFDRPLSPDERDTFRMLIKRRSSGEPVQYILSSAEFWSHALEVTPAVLIPRPDTEVLVEEALQWLRSPGAPARPLVVDVGTGSGAIAIAVAAELPDARVIAIDVSAEALAVAARNVARHGLESRIALRQGSLLECLDANDEAPDAVLSNPPYILSAVIPTLMPEVSLFEPRLALDGGADGLAVLAPLVRQAASRSRTPAVLAVEIGDAEQAAQVCALMVEQGYQAPRVRHDYARLPRVVVATRGELVPPAGAEEDTDGTDGAKSPSP
jgi:release factor glutamine methyltransferase